MLLRPLLISGESLNIFCCLLLEVEYLSEVILGDCQLFVEELRVGSIFKDVLMVLSAHKVPDLGTGQTCTYAAHAGSWLVSEGTWSCSTSGLSPTAVSGSGRSNRLSTFNNNYQHKRDADWIRDCRILKQKGFLVSNLFSIIKQYVSNLHLIVTLIRTFGTESLRPSLHQIQQLQLPSPRNT